MANSRYRLRRILEIIHESLNRTKMSLAAYKYLSTQIESKPIKIASNFFQTARKATFCEAVLGITRLSENDKEAINFKLLLDIVENHPRILPYNLVGMESLVAYQREKLASLDPILQTLRPIRDRELAHLDRKHINDPQVVTTNTVPISDLSHCTEILSQILAEIWQTFYGVPYPGFEDEALISKELEALWTIIEDHLEKARHGE